MTSPFANLYNEVLLRLKAKAISLRYIEQDLQQLENYEMRPPVSWPCALIDIDDFTFSDMGGKNHQQAEGIVQIRVGQIAYSPSNGLAASGIRAAALAYYETEQEVFAALHAWAPAGFSKLLRRSAKIESRNDDLRVRVIRFATSFQDTTGEAVRTALARPGVKINGELPIREMGT